MPRPERLRIACVGAGFFARLHRKAWAALPGADLCAVADPDAARAEATGLPAFASVEAMLDALGPDLSDVVLDVATPPAAHAGCIAAGLDARVRAILCQKPFCGGLPAAEAATEAAEAAGIPLIVHENFRFQPWWRAIAAAMEAGEIGDPLEVAFRLRPGDGQGPDAYLDRQPYFRTMPRFLVHETGVHLIDVFRFLLGEPQAILADLRRLNPAIAGEDAAHLLLRFPSGARARLDANRLLDHEADDLRRTMGEGRAEGTGGALAFGGDGAVRLRRFGARGWREVAPAPPAGSGFGGGCVGAFQAAALEAIRGGPPTGTRTRACIATLRWTEAAYASAEAGAWVSAQGGVHAGSTIPAP